MLRSARDHRNGVSIMSTRVARPVVLCGFLVAVIVIAGGTLFALGYVLIAALSIRDLWFRKETA